MVVWLGEKDRLIWSSARITSWGSTLLVTKVSYEVPLAILRRITRRNQLGDVLYFNGSPPLLNSLSSRSWSRHRSSWGIRPLIRAVYLPRAYTTANCLLSIASSRHRARAILASRYYTIFVT